MTAIVVEDLRQQWRLPRPLFEALHKRYRFDVDAAALAWNAQLPRYWTPQIDGLKQLWDPANDILRVYLNSPFDNLGPWASALHCRVRRGGFAAQIIPVRTYCPWFVNHVRGAEHWFFTAVGAKQGRVNFDPHPGVKKSSNREPLMLAVFDPETFGKGVVGYLDAETGARL